MTSRATRWTRSDGHTISCTCESQPAGCSGCWSASAIAAWIEALRATVAASAGGGSPNEPPSRPRVWRRVPSSVSRARARLCGCWAGCSCASSPLPSRRSDASGESSTSTRETENAATSSSPGISARSAETGAAASRQSPACCTAPCGAGSWGPVFSSPHSSSDGIMAESGIAWSAHDVALVRGCGG